VVAVVNATPIYANQVLGPLKKEFAVKSKEMDEKQFQRFAMKEIGREFEELVDDEMYFATAYHSLTEEDRKLAKMIAMQVRNERVTAAGGSVEQARRQSLELEGQEFDDAMQTEYRRIVHSLYQRRHIEPLIQVSADDMREYYRRNVEKLYSDKDKAQFRVIKVDPAVAGGKQQAMDKINSIRARALHGEDFAALASAENDDSYLKGRAGNPVDAGEWLDRNAYPNDAVEAAIWQIESGQITPVVEFKDALYIAKLDAKHIGVTKTFEDPKVQDDIYTRLRQAQMQELSQRSREDSLGSGIVETDGDRMQVAVDMAMQGYAQSR
jgi:parvulin-like peptidyl-prolyl isomerase